MNSNFFKHKGFIGKETKVLQKLIGKIKSGCSSCDSCEDGSEPLSSSRVKGLCFEKLHDSEKKQFIDLLKQTGLNLSTDEMAVVDEFFAHEGHLSEEFITGRLAEKNKKISEDTVTHVLDLLCRYGLAQKVHLNGTGPWYEHLHLGEKHDHLLCTKCGKVVEFEDEELRKQTARSANLHGFQPLFQKTTIFGICDKCKKKHSGAMPLSALSVGERGVIVDFSGGSNLRKKLSDMGLIADQEVEVLSKTGPVILSVKGSRLAVGKGISHKILVKPIGNNKGRQR